MDKKIYFAGSIRGGRTDAELYNRIISYIQRTDVVLTEHVGGKNFFLTEQGFERDSEIYNQDTATQLSAMLTDNPYFKIHPYEMEEEIYAVLEEILKKL